MGIDVTLVDPMETRAWRKRMRKETRAIFVESPVNPDVSRARSAPDQLPHEGGRPRARGRFHVREPGQLPPHGARRRRRDPLGHEIPEWAPRRAERRRVRHRAVHRGGAAEDDRVGPGARPIRLLAARTRAQDARRARRRARTRTRGASRNGATRGRKCGTFTILDLADHPDHEVARTFLDGFGGMLGLELVGGAKSAERFIRRLHLIKHAPSLGGVDSLVSEPRFSSHSHLTSEERAALGIPDGFLRLSIGIENADDLIADIEQALK